MYLYRQSSQTLVDLSKFVEIKIQKLEETSSRGRIVGVTRDEREFYILEDSIKNLNKIQRLIADGLSANRNLIYL